jgi:hypothetical protein
MVYCTKCNDPILLSSCHGKCLRCWASDNLAAVREADATNAMTAFQTPTVKPHGRRFVIQRRIGTARQLWNGLRCEWVRSIDVHGGSANNPKISYYLSREAAEFELTLIAQSLTPEAAAIERRRFSYAKRKAIEHARINNGSGEPRP